jgi:hypothetical protein
VAKTSENCLNLLASLPRLESFAPVSQQVQAGKDIRAQLFKENVVPIWTGERWIDSLPFALNGFTLGDEAQERLIRLNSEEQNYGFHSLPERKKAAFAGRENLRTVASRVTLKRLGYAVKYDETFGIWRVNRTISKQEWEETVKKAENRQFKLETEMKAQQQKETGASTSSTNEH